MSLALCPGSFDPITLGHLDLVVRAAALFDEVVVGVATNHAKRPLLDADARVRLVREVLAGTDVADRVRVESLGGGLLARQAAEMGAAAVVKGVRSASDVEHESPMALMNRHLTGVETVLLVADPRWAHVSSTMVKEVASLGGEVRDLVPAAVVEVLAAALASRGAERGGPGSG